MQGKHPNSRHAGAHNFALRQICGTIGNLRTQLAQCKSLTPLARLRLNNALQDLTAARDEIRSRRVEPNGSIKEFPNAG